jgi:hypothetical protein
MGPPGRNTTTAVVERLKLDPPLSRCVVEKTQDSLRLLKLKNPIGTFGKNDSEQKRTCALLEYIAREASGYKIPMDRLARVACMKGKDFLAFHQMIGNFKENAGTTRSDSLPQSRSRGPNKGPHAIALAESSIPSLAIQLGAFIPNTNAVAVEAQHLFQEILSYLKRKNSRERINGFEDVRRNQNTYEAVCFYLTATKGLRTNARNGIGNSSSSRPSQLRNSTLPHSDDFDHHLDLATFLDVAKNFTRSQFEMVLKYVAELRQEMKETPGPTDTDTPTGAPSSAPPRRASAMNRTTTRDVQTTHNSRKRYRTGTISEHDSSSAGVEATDQVMMLIEQQDGVEGSTGWVPPSDASFGEVEIHRTLYSPIFLEWKKKMVASAFEAAKNAIERDGIVHNETLNQRDATLDHATQEILLRHNILRHQM